MRAIDDSSPKYAAVMRELLVWKQLPESDVSNLVPGYFLVTDDFREMEDQGLLTMAFFGDEYVLTPTTYGRLWLEQYDNEHKEQENAIQSTTPRIERGGLFEPPIGGTEQA